MFKEILEAQRTKSFFKGVKNNDVVVTIPKTGTLYGVFSEKAIKNSKSDKLEDYDVSSIIDLEYDMSNFPGISDEKLATAVNKFVKQFGVQKDFDSFEPDSKNQSYMKFESYGTTFEDTLRLIAKEVDTVKELKAVGKKIKLVGTKLGKKVNTEIKGDFNNAKEFVDFYNDFKKESDGFIKDFSKNEADGGYGDLGVIPTASSPKLKLKKDDECSSDSNSKKLNDSCKKKKLILKK